MKIPEKMHIDTAKYPPETIVQIAHRHVDDTRDDEDSLKQYALTAVYYKPTESRETQMQRDAGIETEDVEHHTQD